MDDIRISGYNLGLSLKSGGILDVQIFFQQLLASTTVGDCAGKLNTNSEETFSNNKRGNQ